MLAQNEKKCIPLIFDNSSVNGKTYFPSFSVHSQSMIPHRGVECNKTVLEEAKKEGEKGSTEEILCSLFNPEFLFLFVPFYTFFF